MKFTLRHPYSIEPEAFWRDVFFDPAYNEALYRKALQFEAFKVIEETQGPDGRRARKMSVTPKIDAPGPIKSLLGDSVSYVEDGHLDLAKPSWVVKVLPSKLADKSSIRSEMWLERTGPGQSDRVANFEIEVKIFGIGGLVEKAAEKNMREGWETAAGWMRKWFAAHPSA